MAERNKDKNNKNNRTEPPKKSSEGDGGEGQNREGQGKGTGQGGGGGGSNGSRQPNFLSRGALGWILLGGLAVALILLMSTTQNQPKRISWNKFLSYARQGAFEGDVTVQSAQVVGKIKSDFPGVPTKAGANLRRSAGFPASDRGQVYVWQALNETAAADQLKADTGDSFLFQLLLSWGPLILIALLIYFFVFRSLRNAGGGPGGMLGNFGRSKHKMLTKEHSDITLTDVAGVAEAKEEITEVIEFLKSPKKFQRLGGRVPRGMLLIGSPGCGKTLLAKAVAGEADVPFFSISGSDFVEMFVGVGASRVRDLFKQAKESAPCIIFLDEIDAVGRKRGAGFSSGGHDEREQTLNAILVEMDGFDSSDQVVVIAATNRADVLDPALTRPGRFDRQINVPLPDIKGRLEILNVHSRRVKMSPDLDLEKLARGTPMFSGADLAAIINEAAISATLQGKEFIEQEDVEEARDKVKWGRARKSHKIEEDEKRVIAYHEAGHALIMYFDEHAEPLHKVTIIPRGQALGTTFMLPEKDRHIYTREQLRAQLRVAYGGRISEQMFCKDISSGAAQDIRQASQIARAMITEYGMSERLGFLLYGQDEQSNPWEQPDRMYSDETARVIDEEVKSLIDRTYAETERIFQQHSEQLEALAQALLKHETLTRDEVERIMNGEPLNKATVSDLLEQEREKQKKEQEQGETIRPDNTGLEGDTSGGPVPSPA